VSCFKTKVFSLRVKVETRSSKGCANALPTGTKVAVTNHNDAKVDHVNIIPSSRVLLTFVILYHDSQAKDDIPQLRNSPKKAAAYKDQRTKV
jgi:hypothetical protein